MDQAALPWCSRSRPASRWLLGLAHTICTYACTMLRTVRAFKARQPRQKSNALPLPGALPRCARPHLVTSSSAESPAHLTACHVVSKAMFVLAGVSRASRWMPSAGHSLEPGHDPLALQPALEWYAQRSRSTLQHPSAHTVPPNNPCFIHWRARPSLPARLCSQAIWKLVRPQEAQALSCAQSQGTALC